HIRRLYELQKTNTGTCYGIYLGSASIKDNENIIRNNIISDIEFNGYLYGLYLSSASYIIVEHNTVSLDHTTSGATVPTYGMYLSAGNSIIRNNIFTITRGGSSASTRFGYYMGSSAALSNFKAHDN